MEFLGMITERAYITPDIQFSVDLFKSFQFLDNYINSEEFEKIKALTDLYNYKLFKNPSLIIISFIVVKWDNFRSITSANVKKVFTLADISPLIKENHISVYDIVRYSKFILLHLEHALNFSE